MLSRKILSGAIILGISSLLSRVLGVYRDHLLGIYFGTHGQGIMDVGVYYTAFRIPDLLYTLVIYGAVSSSFIPIFSEYLAKHKEDDAWKFAKNILNILIIFLIFLSLIILIFAPYILGPFMLGFSGERFELAVDLTRIMLFSSIFFGISSIFQAVQNSFKTFLYVGIAPLIYNVSLIIGVVFFSKDYGVYALAYSVVIGSFLHMICQLPKILRLGFKYQFLIDFRLPDVKRFFLSGLPRVFGLSIDQLSLSINASIATTLSYSATTILPYAINIQSLPLGLFGIAFAIASFSTFSELVSKKDFDNISKTLRSSISSILFFVIPSVFGLYILRFDIISLIFEGGAFTAQDVSLTASVLSFLLIGLAFQALIPILTRVFYSFNNTLIPVSVGIFAIIVNTVIVISLTRFVQMDIEAISIAMSVSAVVNTIILMYFMKIKLKLNDFLPIKSISKILFSSFLMFIALLWFCKFFKNIYLYQGSLAQVLLILIITAFGGLIYLSIAYVLRIDEIDALLMKVKNRLKL